MRLLQFSEQAPTNGPLTLKMKGDFTPEYQGLQGNNKHNDTDLSNRLSR